MDDRQALSCFAALSQPLRLAVIRALVRAGADGISAGALAAEVGTSASNLSFHLKELEHAGLISARRISRSIIYSADYAVLRALVGFLWEDCCGGTAAVFTGAALPCGCTGPSPYADETPG